MVTGEVTITGAGHLVAAFDPGRRNDGERFEKFQGPFLFFSILRQRSRLLFAIPRKVALPSFLS